MNLSELFIKGASNKSHNEYPCGYGIKRVIDVIRIDSQPVSSSCKLEYNGHYITFIEGPKEVIDMVRKHTPLHTAKNGSIYVRGAYQLMYAYNYTKRKMTVKLCAVWDTPYYQSMGWESIEDNLQYLNLNAYKIKYYYGHN